MRIYSYLCHAVRPLGLGDDDSQVLPYGTLLGRACKMLAEVGIADVITHTVPFHPESEIGKLASALAYPDMPGWPAKTDALFRDCWKEALNGGNEQIMASDGGYEKAVAAASREVNLVTATPINAIAMWLKQLALPDGVAPYRLDELYPEYLPTGRSMDIWNPAALDALEWAYKGLSGPKRRLGGLWLTLGGPFLWGETSHLGDGTIYRVRTPAAREALGRDGDIDMQAEGRHYAPIIVARLGRLAVDLVDRLKNLTRDFYFHVNPVPPYSMKAPYQAAGMAGTAQELCERFAGRTDVAIHLIISHAWDCSPQTAEHVQALIRRFPQIEFIAGVGWEPRLRASGMARLCEGYQAIEVGCEDAAQWADLPAAVAHVRRLASML